MKIIFKYFFFGIFFYSFQLNLPAQNSKIDSLFNLIKKDKPDTNKVNHLNALSWEYINIGEYDNGLKYGNKARALANSLPGIISDSRGRIIQGWPKGIASSYNNIGIIYKNQGNYPGALKNYFVALKIWENIGDKKGIADSFHNIGLVYMNQGNYPEALKKHSSALKIRVDIGDKKGIALSYHSIGLVYWNQAYYPEALKNYLSALKIREEIGDKKGIAASLNNIGIIYNSQGNYSEALKNQLASLKIKKDIQDKQGIANSYNSIGIIYTNQGDYTQALKNYFASLKIKEEIKDKQGIAFTYNNIGAIYNFQGNYPLALKNYYASLKINEEIGDKNAVSASFINLSEVQRKTNNLKEARNYLDKALQLSKEIGNREKIKDSYSGFGKLDSTQNDWKAAYQHYKLFIIYRDSIDNEETKKKTIERSMNYEFEKREITAKALQNKKDAIIEEESQRQKVIKYSISVVLFLVLVIALFIYRGFRLKQKANIIISEQKAEVEKQKELIEEKNKIVEEKNKEITDSINYARRIQQAKLPKKSEIYTSLPQSFVLFKPKDIVSGDFYFFHKSILSLDVKMNQIVFIAAADCTGHGVPGAFMSMIGSEKLDDAVSHTIDPSEILKLINQGIKTSLRQSETIESTKDGMDIALCSVDIENGIVKYAGANRPIWIIRNGQKEIEETKATKKAIGGFTTDSEFFETHELKLQKGDTFYIFTDGYADQFGGMEGKKLMTKRFKEILLDIQDKTMQDQEKYLDMFVNDWRGNIEQIDDILVIGVRI